MSKKTFHDEVVDPIFGRPSVPYVQIGRADYYIEPTTSLIFQRELPTMEEMEGYVQAEYRAGSYQAYSKAKPLKYETGTRRLAQIQKYGVVGKKYLDVGCATGIFLEAALDKGFDVTGIELSEEACSAASESVRVKIVVADVNKYIRESGTKYDLVTAYDILEHVQDPRAFLCDILGALAPGGVLAIATPATDHFLRKLMGKSWPMLQPLQHTFMFSQRGLKELLIESGFVDVQIGPAEKVLTLEYLFEQVAEPSPVLGRFLISMGKLIPSPLRRKPLGLNISEMFALARIPADNSREMDI